MIRVTRIQDVLDFDSGQMRSVMVLGNSVGLTAEVTLTPEQATALVRLYEADNGSAAPSAGPTPPPMPQPAVASVPAPAAHPPPAQDGLSGPAAVSSEPYDVGGQQYAMTKVSYEAPTPGETYEDDDEPAYGGGVGQL